MTADTPIRTSDALRNVRYEIRGKLARRAQELARKGYEIISLNIGNPALFGFRTPETMRLAMIENFPDSEGYCHQKGIFPAREAVVMQQQARGVTGVSAEEVFIGNGVSELIDLCLRAMLNDGDEVLVPSPDYPLWSAAVNLNRGKAVHYPCHPENGFVPDVEELAALITPRTRAIVVINPNNPTGAVYPRAVLEAIARLAEQRGLMLLCDEIYDQILYDDAEFVPMASLVHDTVCVTMSGLSKVYRACGYRVGWAVVSGKLSAAQEFLSALELLASLRLCSNVPGQWAVQTALGGYQSIRELTRAGDCSNPAVPSSMPSPPTPRSSSPHHKARCTVSSASTIRSRTSTTRRSHLICSSVSTCSLRPARVSMSPIRIISVSPIFPMQLS
jgi:alanine-synthesizing transaminase